MEGKTHRLGGTVCALAGFIAFKESGYLLPDEVVSPALQFLVVYSAGIYGGMWSDNDHHWESSPLKDPASWVQNKLLHLANKPYKVLDERLSSTEKRSSFFYKTLKFLACRHRSWQTHSEVTLLAIWWLMTNPQVLFNGAVDSVLWMLVMMGFGLGVISHLLLDCLTTEGIRFALGVFIRSYAPSFPIPETIRFVPPSPVFKTGSNWELMIRKGLAFTQYVLILIVILYAFGISVPTLLTGK